MGASARRSIESSASRPAVFLLPTTAALGLTGCGGVTGEWTATVMAGVDTLIYSEASDGCSYSYGYGAGMSIERQDGGFDVKFTYAYFEQYECGLGESSNQLEAYVYAGTMKKVKRKWVIDVDDGDLVLSCDHEGAQLDCLDGDDQVWMFERGRFDPESLL